MKTAREIIAGALAPEGEAGGVTEFLFTDSILAALAAEGFSIVETGRDPVTIEACAKVADDMFKPEHDFGRVGSLIAHSIRFPPTREGKTE